MPYVMSANEQAAFLAGRVARRAGRPFSANPHPLGTSLSRAWSKGYKSE